MIRSSAALAANDLSVQCRVRRSETVSDPEFDDYVDMTCTMRNWMKPSKPSKALKQYNLEKTNSTASNPSDTTLGMIANHEGPELLMCPSRRSEGDFPMIMQEHVRSSGSGGGDYRSSSASRSRSNSISRRRMWSEMYPDDARQQEEEKPLPQPYSIPVYDIVVVDSMGSRSNGIFLTTQCMGYFEFTFYTSNAHDVFMAFLTNTLPYERITHTCSTPLEACTSSFDVETLTATRMYQRVEEETLSERMRRKFNFMANRIGELSASLSDCACNCDFGGQSSPSTNRGGDDARRQAPPRHFEFPTELLEVESTSTPNQFRSADGRWIR